MPGNLSDSCDHDADVLLRGDFPTMSLMKMHAYFLANNRKDFSKQEFQMPSPYHGECKQPLFSPPSLLLSSVAPIKGLTSFLLPFSPSSCDMEAGLTKSYAGPEWSGGNHRCNCALVLAVDS